MKKIIIIVFLTNSIFNFNIASSQIVNQRNTKLNELQGIKSDTIVVRKIELSLNKKFINTYKRDEEAFKILSPHFLKEIVSPLDTKNSAYLAYMDLGKTVLKTVRESALKEILLRDKWREKFLNGSSSPEAFDQYQFVQIPIYYLTPNVVLFKDGENIAKYYNLITSDIRYAIIKDDTYFGMITYYQGEIRLVPINKYTSIGYSEILKLKKPIIGLSNYIPFDTKPVRSMVNMFGYMLDQHIVFSYYDEGPAPTKENRGIQKMIYEKRYTMELADAFYSSETGYPILNQRLNSYKSSIKHFREEK